MTFSISAAESALVDACLNNERLAQKTLYDKYKDAMFTVAYRITNNFELAQDVLQDAFIQIFKSLKSFRKESTIGAWIKIIVVRTALKAIKKQPHFSPIEDYIIGNKNQYIDWGNYLDAEYLEKAIQALPDGYRAVFVLIEVEGYPHKEVAKLLNISEGTSKSQLFHAKKKLRAMLKEIDNHEGEE